MLCDVALCHRMCELDICNFSRKVFFLPDSEGLVSCERGHVMCTACTHVPRVPGVCSARAQDRYLTWHCDLEDICPGPRD